MNWLQQPWLENLGWTLLHSLWQLSAIAAIAFLALLAVRRHSSQLRYAIAYTLLLLMMATTLGTYAYLWSHRAYAIALPTSPNIAPAEFIAPSVTIASLPPTALTSAPTLRDRALSALHFSAPYAASLYLAGAAFVTLRLLAGYAALRRLRANALATPDHQMLLEQLRRRLHVTKPVQLLQSPHVEVPTVFGAWRPLILLPLTTTTGLSAEHLTCLLLHELAHIRRHDYLANLIQSVIETLLFYHPAVLWLSAYIRQEREHCCDDIAICNSDRAGYAAALVSMESLRASPALALGARGGSLLQRVRRIVNAPAPRRIRHRIINVSSLLTAAALIAAFAFYLAACSRNDTPQSSTTSAATSPRDIIVVGATSTTAPSPNRPAQVGDILNLTIYELLGSGQNYTSSVPVDENGNVHLLYVGDVRAVGKTPRELADVIAHTITEKALLERPDVRVSYTNEIADLRPLETGDLLNTEVFEIEAPGKMTSEIAVVDDKGDIFVRHLDHIHVAGLTPTQAAARITSAAVEKAVLRNPYAQITRINRNQQQLMIETRIFFVTDTLLTSLHLAPAPQPNAVLLSDAERSTLLKGIADDPSTVSVAAPRITIFSPGYATIILADGPLKGAEAPERHNTSISVGARASDDHKSVHLNLRSIVSLPHRAHDATTSDQPLVAELSVPDKGTAMQIGTPAGDAEPGQRFVVLVCPKIIAESAYDKTIYDRAKPQ